MNQIKNMSLHETETLENGIQAIRVEGGWIYLIITEKGATSSFVPEPKYHDMQARQASSIWDSFEVQLLARDVSHSEYVKKMREYNLSHATISETEYKAINAALFSNMGEG